MAQDTPKRSTTGFRKGFLLSKKSVKRKEKAKASSDLLEIEEDRSSDPFLIVTEQEPEIHMNPLYDPLEDSNENDLGLFQVSTRRKSPLIQEHVFMENHQSKQETRAEVIDKKEPLLSEVTTLRRREKDSCGSQPKKVEENAVELDADSKQPTAPLHLSEESADTKPMNYWSDSQTIAKPTTSPIHSAQELSRVLWTLQQHAGDDGVAREFVTRHLQSEWTFVWDFILEAIAQDPSSTNPSVRLGMVMLEHELDSFVPFLRPTSDKRSRVLALGAAELTRCYTRRIRETTRPIEIMVWLKEVLPRLTCTVMEVPGKRTLLSQRCMTCAVELMATVAEQTNANDCADGDLFLRDTMSTLGQLLDVQRGWIIKSMPKMPASPGQFSPEASRKGCMLAVIADWKNIIKEGQRIYERTQLEDAVDSDAYRMQLTRVACTQLAGESLDGLETIAVGGLIQTLSHDPPKLTADQILLCLESALELLYSIREKKESKDEDLEWQKERLHSILRGVAAWLGQHKKHLQRLNALPASADTNGAVDSAMPRSRSGATIQEQATGLCIRLLRSDGHDSVNLVLTILNHLWSSSNGLPPDFIPSDSSESSFVSSKLPASYGILLDELKGENQRNSAILEPTERAVCFLVARCIQLGGPALVKELVARNGVCASTVEVLAHILVETGQIVPDNGISRHEQHIENADLSTVVGVAFLDCVRSHRAAQKELLSSPDMLCCLPVELVVPKLIALVDFEVTQPSDAPNDIVAAASAALNQIMLSSLPNNINDVVRVVIESLLQCDDRSDGDQGEAVTHRSNKICKKVTGKWRRSLLQNPVCSLEGFAAVLVSIARAMFQDPSNSLPLTLLGSVVGDELSLTESTEDTAKKVYFAMVAMVRESLCEINRTGDAAMVREDTDRRTLEDHDVFHRLSPLLLLRRIPSAYYKVAWDSDDESRGELVALLSELAGKLALRLDISCPPKQTNIVFSSEERRLAAEIAGNSLPFYADPVCSCFHRICSPAFSSTLRNLKVLPGDTSIGFDESVRVARAALYACCHSVPLMRDNDLGKGLQITISFVLQVINIDVGDDHTDKGAGNDLIQLQTGCIEFIAFCLETTLRRRISQSDEERRKSTRGISEVESRSNVGGGSIETGESTGAVLTATCSSIVSSLRTGSKFSMQLQVGDDGFLEQVPNGETRSPSTAARTCLWNAFLVLSQRCRQEDGCLTTWAMLTAPWVLDWGSHAPVNSDLYHPLCMAAALQVVFVLITRTKSFDCLGDSRAADGVSSSVRRAHRWAMESIKSRTEMGGDYARRAMRKAALKLMLAITTIDQLSIGGSCLSPGDQSATFTVLQGVANLDADAEVRTLAAHILSKMGIQR